MRLLRSSLAFFAVVLVCQGNTHFRQKFTESLKTSSNKDSKTFDEEGDIHAVLIAGSKGIGRAYRHQANVAHAYHVLLDHGVSADNIVVLMYDDVVNDTENPFPGQLFNAPDGPDVYEGLEVDYRGEDVTIENFVSVLKGNESAVTGGTGRVLTSGPNDRVFVYYTDHGNVGIIAFPSEQNNHMTAQELLDVLNWMYENNKFAQLTFYLEACYSGSMFEGVLPENINVYAITAANASQHAYATYCHLPKYNNFCLSDQFTSSWLIDSVKKDPETEKLEEQYETVKEGVTRSEVQEFGNVSIAEEPVGLFQGSQNITLIDQALPKDVGISVPAQDAELYRLVLLEQQSNNKGEAALLMARINAIHRTRLLTNVLSSSLVKTLIADQSQHEHILETYESVKDLECHHRVVKSFDVGCPRLAKNDDCLDIIHVLSNLCTALGDADLIINALNKKCAKFGLSEN